MRLILTFNEALDEDSVPLASAFTVKVNGNEVSLANDNPKTMAGATVVLTLASAVAEGDFVTVSYTKPTSGSGNRLKDEAGYEVANFTDRTVGPDDTPPWLVGAEVDGGTVTHVYSELLDTSLVPPKLDFPQFKRRKRGSPSFGGTERRGILACRG